MGELRVALAGEDSADAQAERVNALLRTFDESDGLDSEIALPARLLQGIKGRSPLGAVVPLPPPPATPFSQSDLLVNAEGQPNVGSELRAELASADSVDLICAFVIWSGVRHLREALAGVKARGGRVRVITTTYMGATEKRAVDELVALGAEVRVAFDARTTKLHAKAWLLERGVGPVNCLRWVVESLAHRPLRWAGVECPALFDGCRACHRSGSNDLRESLGVGALRAVRPRDQR